MADVSSADTPLAKFDTSVTKLLQVMNDIPSTENTLWRIYLGKFSGNYFNAKNPKFFANLFSEFFEAHSLNLIRPVYHDDEIHHGWLLNFDRPSRKQAGKRGLPPPPAGVAIFLDRTKEILNSVSLPLSEAYQAAQDHYDKMLKKDSLSDLPGKMLWRLYTCVLHALEVINPDGYAAAIKSLQSNVDVLHSIVEAVSTSTTESSTGRGLNGITGFLSNMASKLTGKNVSDFLSKTFGEDAQETIKSGLSTVQNVITDPSKLDSAVSGLKTAYENGNLGETISKMTQPLLSAFNGNPENGTPATMDPSDQE
jgi:hypothetical protein